MKRALERTSLGVVGRLPRRALREFYPRSSVTPRLRLASGGGAVGRILILALAVDFGFMTLEVILHSRHSSSLAPRPPIETRSMPPPPLPLPTLFPRPLRFLLQPLAHNLRDGLVYSSPVSHLQPTQRAQQLRPARLHNLFVSRVQRA